MAKLVSIIIPVYNAEKTLLKCVESIVYGRYTNVEVILVDDCSRDGSWELCCQLRDRYPQVKCVQNPVNSGVSVTRNHGVDVATGQYICFVDSDDWVSGRFVETLVREAEAHPQELPVCGFRFMNYVDSQTVDYLCKPYDKEVFFLPRSETFQLISNVWMQCVWNKIFHADIIKQHGICFPPKKSMGEDFEFILTYLEKCECTGYRMINHPLYYYVRANTSSLMSQFGLNHFEEEAMRYSRVFSICDDGAAEGTYQNALENLKRNFYYHILRAKQLSKSDMVSRIKDICADGKEHLYYRRARNTRIKENLFKRLMGLKRFPDKVCYVCRRFRNKQKVACARRKITAGGVSVISQNCIGGVLYHDLGQEFLSPTVNLYMNAVDFIKFAADLPKYLSLSPEMRWDEEYPIGILDDITIRFMHYETCTDAIEAWHRRCKRIDWNRILIIGTDRDGFTEVEFNKWKQLPYPKVLFTANSAFSGHADSVYFHKYRKQGCVPDLIPKREFYRDGAVIRAFRHYSR